MRRFRRLRRRLYRRFKRRRYGRSRTRKIALWRLPKRVLPEVKIFRYQQSRDVPVFTNLGEQNGFSISSGLPQGTGPSQRIGQVINIKRCTIRYRMFLRLNVGEVAPLNNGGYYAMTMRNWLVQDRWAQQATDIPVASFFDVPGTYYGQLARPDIYENQNRYKILKTWTTKIDNTRKILEARTVTVKNMKRGTYFDLADSGIAAKGHLWWFYSIEYIGKEATIPDVNTLDIRYSATLSYTDA